MQEVIEGKLFFTPLEIANFLGEPIDTVVSWIENGSLQAWKTAGGHRRVSRSSLDQLLQKKAALLPGRSLATPATATSRRLKVLVVEDDPILLRLYQAQIAVWSMAPEVIAVDNAFMALVLVGRHCPDLLITDLKLPGMDGIKMLRTLRIASEISNATIVVVTGLDMSSIDAQGGLPYDIEVLSKPIPFDRLLAIANEIVSHKRLQTSPD